MLRPLIFLTVSSGAGGQRQQSCSVCSLDEPGYFAAETGENFSAVKKQTKRLNSHFWGRYGFDRHYEAYSATRVAT